MNVSTDPRRRAVEVLVRVDVAGAHAARLLDGASPLARELVLGTLRWQRTLDALLASDLRQPLGALDAPVRGVLRAGLYEAARLDTPVAVAVSEAVRVARALAPRAAGLVNAVLRRAAARPWPEAGDESLALGVRLSHPDWIAERWIALLGREAAEDALAADQTPAPMTLLEAATDTRELERAGVELEAHPYVAGVAVVRGGAAAAAEVLRRGVAYAMDPHAVLAARVLGAGRDDTIVDLAAAPGGKAILSAVEGRARVVAADRGPGRVGLLRANVVRLAAPVEVLVADALVPPFQDGRFSAAILDAPCSGTGTLRRHPEIRWRLSPESMSGLAGLQLRMLQAAVPLLAPGGRLLYVTCSLEPEENSAVVEASGLAPLPLPAFPAQARVKPLSSGGAVIPPGEHGDGFTVHLLGRS